MRSSSITTFIYIRDKGPHSMTLTAKILKIEFKNLFKAFILFAILYNGYRYFFPWDRGGDAPTIPLYFSILKDVPWAIIVFFGLWGLYRNKINHTEQLYGKWIYYDYWTVFFIITHLILLSVAIAHLFHKNPIDVLQRDIKNVQYIFLPFIFPLIINDEQDIINHLKWLIIIGVSVSIFGYYTYLFVPAITWENAVLSTFQSPICFGTFSVILFLISLSRVLIDKEVSLYWYIAMCLFYGSILISASAAALLSMAVGTLFLLFISRPRLSFFIKRVSALFIISSLIFYSLGFFNMLMNKATNSVSDYKALNGSRTYEEVEIKSTNTTNITNTTSTTNTTSFSWDFLRKPYEPKSDNTYHFKNQYTSISARKAYFEEITTYLKTASIKNILWGDFSLKNQFEYDNVYFYFIKNDGIIVTALLFSLLISGIFIGYNKFKKFSKTGNNNMASLSLGITAALFILTFIQFNLSYFLTIYPINFLTYFLLTLIVFMNPPDNSNIRSRSVS